MRDQEMIDPVKFNSIKFMRKLRSSGMEQKEAEAIAEGIGEAMIQVLDDKEVATKKDIEIAELRLERKINAMGWKVIGSTATLYVLFGIIQHIWK